MGFFDFLKTIGGGIKSAAGKVYDRVTHVYDNYVAPVAKFVFVGAVVVGGAAIVGAAAGLAVGAGLTALGVAVTAKAACLAGAGILGVAAAFNKDPSPQKVNLSVGAYRD